MISVRLFTRMYILLSACLPVLISSRKYSPNISSHQQTSLYLHKTGRWEMPGSILDGAYRPSRSKFSVPNEGNPAFSPQSPPPCRQLDSNTNFECLEIYVYCSSLRQNVLYRKWCARDRWLMGRNTQKNFYNITVNGWNFLNVNFNMFILL